MAENTNQKPEVDAPEGPAPATLEIVDIVEGTGQEATPAHGHHDGPGLRGLGHDLQADRALAGDDQRVVEGRHPEGTGRLGVGQGGDVAGFHLLTVPSTRHRRRGSRR